MGEMPKQNRRNRMSELTIDSNDLKNKYIEYYEKDRNRTLPGKYRIGYVVKVGKHEVWAVDFQTKLNKRYIDIKNVMGRVPKNTYHSKITFTEDGVSKEGFIIKTYKQGKEFKGFTVIDFLLPKRKIPQEDVIGQITRNGIKRSVTWENKRKTSLLTNKVIKDRNKKLKDRRNKNEDIK